MSDNDRCSGALDHTIEELLFELETIGINFRGQKYVGAQLSYLLKRPLSEIMITELRGVEYPLSKFLLNKGWKLKSVRSQISGVHRLDREAVALGWMSAPPPKLTPEWNEVIPRLKPTKGQGKLLERLNELGVIPSTLCEEDLTEVREEMIRGGASFPYSKEVVSAFKRAIREAHLQSAFPCLRNEIPRFGIPLDEFDDPLRSEVTEWLDWRQLDWASDRPRKYRKLSEVSAETLFRAMSQLLGYRVVVLKEPLPASIEELVTERLVKGFVQWCSRDRKIDGDRFFSKMGAFYHQLKIYPKLAHVDLSWFPAVLRTIPRTSPEVKESRDDRKKVQFERLTVLVTQLASKAKAGAKA